MKLVIKLMAFVGLSVGVVFANPNWSVNPADYQYNGSVTSSVSVDGLSIGAGDQIGAFVGDELRGVGDAAFFPPTGSHIFLTMIFSNQATGESLNFKLYDAETDQIVDLDESLPFASDMTEGNGFSPFSLSGEVATADLHVMRILLHGLSIPLTINTMAQ